MHAALKGSEEDDTLSPQFVEELGSILLMKQTFVVDGVKWQIIASAEVTKSCLRDLLSRKHSFMQYYGLHDGDASYIFSHNDRAAVMKHWKDEYHAQPDQVERQQRDQEEQSKKEDASGASQPSDSQHRKCGSKGKQGKGKSGDKKKDLVRGRKQSRFARHLQRVAGSKHIAELIVYTGRVDVEELKRLGDIVCKPMESLAKRDNNLQLKIQAAEAKVCLRQGKYFSSRIERGYLDPDNLLPSEKELVTKFKEGKLQRAACEAMLAYGHGTLRDEHGNVTEIRHPS